jgi:pyrroloquinoline quinone biosynthesis protein B
LKLAIKNILLLYFLFGNYWSQDSSNPYLLILGTVQDAGSPHMGCQKKCCEKLFNNPDPTRKVISIGIVDPKEKKFWMIEATPDFVSQCKELKKMCGFTHEEVPDGIFLTHAHIGHYTGLMYLGREAFNSQKVPVFAMTRMGGFLLQNGPWNQLLKIDNISLSNINNNKELKLSGQVSVTPFLVPHRDEFSETVGYKISSSNKSILFIPDIDKWGKWNKDLVTEIKNVDLALVDGTFYDASEVNYRDMSEIPHPFVKETMKLLENESEAIKSKIGFIHLNHTNPLLDSSSQASKTVLKKGFRIMRYKQKIEL